MKKTNKTKVVPDDVIRCKDCVWSKPSDKYFVFCGFFDAEMRKRDFCSYCQGQEVARCKDCKHWSSNVTGYTSDKIGRCEREDWMVGENGYCVYAERKEVQE